MISTIPNEKTINPKRLTEAREAKGLVMADLARILNLSRQAVSAFEKGNKKPSMETLLRISEILGFPIHFFTTNKDSPDIDSAVFFRSRSSATKKERLIGKTKAQWVSLILSNLTNYAEIPKTNLPDIELNNFEILENSDIEEIATKTRRHWGLQDGPIKNLTALLESNGIIISHINSSDKVDAFSFFSESRAFIISGQSTAVRMRFNLAHELGHLILHSHLNQDDIEKPDTFRIIEKQADVFAGCFLMPANTLSEEFFSSKMSALLHLKQRWKVSLGAINYRASDLNLINESQKQYIFRQLAPYRKKEPLDDLLQKEEPTLIKTLISVLEEHNLITKNSLLDSLGLPLADLSIMTGYKEHDFLNTNNNILAFKPRY